jgi:hypothetical protein
MLLEVLRVANAVIASQTSANILITNANAAAMTSAGLVVTVGILAGITGTLKCYRSFKFKQSCSFLETLHLGCGY